MMALRCYGLAAAFLALAAQSSQVEDANNQDASCDSSAVPASLLQKAAHRHMQVPQCPSCAAGQECYCTKESCTCITQGLLGSSVPTAQPVLPKCPSCAAGQECYCTQESCTCIAQGSRGSIVPIVQPAVTATTCSGITAQGKCWYLSETGGNCADTCAKNGRTFSFVVADNDRPLTPGLCGHEPKTKQQAWAALECYVASEDRYHTANANAAKHHTDEELGAFSSEECKLSCPCGGAVGSIVPAVQPQIPQTQTPQCPICAAGQECYCTNESCTCIAKGLAGSSLPDTQPAVTATTCSGITAQGKCWYLSETGGTCADTCAKNGRTFSFVVADNDRPLTPGLCGHEPQTKQQAWAALECYVASEDRYHTANANAAKHHTDEELGDFSSEECKLACPCGGAVSSIVPAVQPQIPQTQTPQCPVCAAGQECYCTNESCTCIAQGLAGSRLPDTQPAVTATTCSGITAQGKCWYLSDTGGNCADTCAKNGRTFSFVVADEDRPLTPGLCGHEPQTKQEKWAALECYVASEDRYHTANANAAKHHTDEELGAFSSEECKLSCPCGGAVTTQKDKCTWKQPPACAAQFVYKGVEYAGCAMVDTEHEKAWCQHDYQHAESGPGAPQDWSYCIYDCGSEPVLPVTAPVPTPSDELLCVWQAKQECQGTFQYKGVDYTGCANVDHPTPWCSYDRVHKGSWSTCTKVCSPRPNVSPQPEPVLPKPAPVTTEEDPCTRHPEVENDLIGASVTLDEAGYKIAARADSAINMKRFICRVIGKVGCKVKNDGFEALMGFVPYYSGVDTVQSYARLESELKTLCDVGGKWVESIERR